MNAQFPRESCSEFHKQNTLSGNDASIKAVGIDEALINTLHFGDFHDRWDAVKQISKQGDIVIPELLALLRSDTLDPEGRWFVVRELGQFDHPEVISALVSQFSTTNDEELLTAIGESLGQIGQNAIVALTGFLQNPSYRLVAVQTLARIHHPATIQPLLQVVEDADATVRATALQGLIAHHRLDTLPVVVQALEDKATQVRFVALQGLIGFHQQVGDEQLLQWLTPRLWDLDLKIAQQAVHILGRLDKEPATAALLTVVTAASTPQPLQISAIQALGWQATPSAMTGLFAVWDRVNFSTRQEIIRALEQFAKPHLRTLASQQIQTWLANLAGDEAAVPLKRKMVLALGTLGNSSVEGILKSHLADPDPGVCLHAEAALAKLHNAS